MESVSILKNLKIQSGRLQAYHQNKRILFSMQTFRSDLQNQIQKILWDQKKSLSLSPMIFTHKTKTKRQRPGKQMSHQAFCI